MAGPDEWVDDEWVDDEWVDDSASPAPVQAAPQSLAPAALPAVGSNQRNLTAKEWFAEPPAPNMSVSQSGMEGATLAEEINANLGAVPDDFNPVNAFKAAYGIAQPLLREGVKEPLAPLVTQAQTAIRESGFAKPVTDPALLVGGRPAETLAQNAMSLFVGSPNQYQTTQEMEQRATEVADSPLAAGLGKAAIAVGGGVPGAIAAPFVDDMNAAGLAYEGTKEAAYLPLYLIDAPATSGAAMKAIIGGGVSEAIDQRPGSDIARGIAFAGSLGAGFEAAGAVGAAAIKAAKGVQWLRTLDTAVAKSVQDAISVTPGEDLKKLVDAPVAGPMKAGAKASFSEARVGEQGAIEARKVAVTADGQKLAGEWLPVGERGLPVRGVVLATPEAAEAMGKLDGEFGEVLVAKDMGADDLALSARPGYDREEVILKQGDKERVALQDDAALPLHELPETDALIARVKGTGPLEFRPVRARTLQRESLLRRNLVEVDVAGETRLGFEGGNGGTYDASGSYKGPDGNRIIIAPDPAEKIPGALEYDVNVPPDRIFDVMPDKVSRILDARDALLAQEAMARVDAAEAEAATIAATIDPAVVVQTPTGPKIAVTSTNGQPPPQPMPPGPPQPQTPTPQTPIMATGNGGIVPPGGMITPAMAAPPPPSGNFVGQGINLLRTAGQSIVDLFINPAARGARGRLNDPRRGPAAFQSQGKVMLLAATSASAAQAAGATESIIPRMLKAYEQRVAPWIEALPPARQSEFKRDVAAVLTSQQLTVAQLKQKWPQLTAGIEQAVLDQKMSTAIKQQKLINAGWQERKVLPAPAGMDSIVDDIIDDEIYAARIYLAPLAGPGEMKRMLEADAVLHAEILNDIAKAEILPKKPVGTQPVDVIEEARLKLEQWLGNPENIIADRPGDTRTANRQGAAGLKERRAGNLEIAAKTYAEWKTRVFAGKNATPQTQQEVIRQSMRFVKGVTDEGKFNAALNRAGFTLDPKDIAFLKAFRQEVSERVLPWQKKALRIVSDPFVSAPFTTVRQDSLLMQMEATNAARQAGGLRSFGELTQMGIDPVLEGWKEVPLDKSRFGPWAGREGSQKMFVAPEFWEGLNGTPDAIRQLQQFTAEMVNSKYAVVRAAGKGHFAAKSAMTIGSPGAWASNVYGGVTGTMKAGVTPVDMLANGNWKRAVDQWKEFVARPNEVYIAGQKIPGSHWMREGMKYGTVGADAFSKEFEPMMKMMLRDDVLGAVTGIHSFGGVYRQLTKAGQWTAERYSAIDSVFRHGTWLTLLKKGGIDLDTGKLVDRAAADRLINGSRFRQAVGPAASTAMDLSKMSDEQVAEALKQAMAWRVRRASSVPGQPGVATEAVSAMSNATLGVTGNMFARTAMEEARSNMMVPYRAATEPGVAGALLQWGALAGATAIGVQHLRRSMGISDEDVQNSLRGLPTMIRSYSPQMMGLWSWDENGRVVMLDVSKIFEPLRYTAGDFLGRSIADQGVQSPGQLAARTAYNIIVGSAGGNSPAKEQILDPMARAAGLQIRPPYEAPEIEPGPINFALRMAQYIGQGLPRQVAAAYGRSQDPNSAGAGEFVKPLTGGTMTVGGTPDQASKNMKNETWLSAEPDRQKALERAARRTGDEDRQQELRDEKSRLKQQKGTFAEENP